jgi:hypothetical protein
MLTSLLSLPFRFLGATSRRPAARRRAPAPRRTILAVEWLEQRDVPSVTIAPTTLPNPKVGAKYSPPALAGNGGTSPYTFKPASGSSMPPGLTLSSTGTISGTPTAGGSFSFTITATDSSSPAQTGSQKYTVTVSAPTITLSPRTLKVVPGLAFSQTITATGGTPKYTFSITKGSLPSGLTLNNTTGVITGTTHAAGRFTFTITAKDSSTGTGPFTGSRTYTVAVNPAHFLFLTQPGSAAVNANLPPFVVEALDQSGKPVTGQVTLTLITVVSEATAGFKSGSTTKVTLTNGVATFSKVAITARGRYVLRATIGSMSVFSDFFDIALDGRHSPGQ